MCANRVHVQSYVIPSILFAILKGRRVVNGTNKVSKNCAQKIIIESLILYMRTSNVQISTVPMHILISFVVVRRLCSLFDRSGSHLLLYLCESVQPDGTR